MSEYIKISDVMKIYKSLYNGYGTTASFNVPVFVDLLRTVAVEFPEPPESNELKDKAAACEFWYQKYYSLYLPLLGLRDRIEQAKFFNQRAGRELWSEKPKDVQDRDIASSERLYDNLLSLIKEDDAEWIDNKCSICGKGIENLIESREWYENEKPNYCPFCGTRFIMKESDAE